MPKITRYRTRSLLQLTLLGFTLVTLPLVGALVVAFVNVDWLASHSQSALFDATRALQSSQVLMEEITEIERYARQFQVLQDRAVWRLYEKERAQFEDVVARLETLGLVEGQRLLLGELVGLEQQLFEMMRQGSSAEGGRQSVAEGFAALGMLGRSLLTESSSVIESEARRARRRAHDTQQLLFWEGVATIPVALLLALLFTFLISRPLHQIGGAIRKLGTGDFNAPVRVDGPRDIEELGQRLEWLRGRLAELENQKILALRHISHEVKTPLTAIREGAELLGEGVLGPLSPEQQEVAEILCQNSLRLQKRIEDLMSFSVQRSPQPNGSWRRVALHELMAHVLLDHKLAMRAKHLSLQTRLNACFVQGDPEQLGVVFDNLLSNAIKYSPSGGQLEVALEAEGDRAVVEVVDQGQGVHPGDRERIFEPFYQGEVASQGPVKGTGLGLAIAREFSKLHQGRLELVESRAGARFRWVLPLDETS
jgi:two-component system sensor histidine kinase GlrK